jgi:hypothetical protein
MQKIIGILNGMSPENMEKLEGILSRMSPENMKKLEELLKTMTPESLSFILEKFNIGEILKNYPELDNDSMAQLLELYSFTEKKYDKVLVHRYKNGETPIFQKLIRNRTHKKSTCDSVKELRRELGKFNGNTSTPTEDEEFQKVFKECNTNDSISPRQPRVITGGGRKRKTLKKKCGGNSKR